jgi:hypothetical protein
MTTHQDPLARENAEPQPGRGSALRLAAVLMALGCAMALWAVQHVAVQTGRGQRLDDRLLAGIRSLTGSTLQQQAATLGQASFTIAVIVALALGLSALVQVRPDRLVVLAVTVGGANVATQVLKHVLIERPVLTDSAPNSLPSGHMTMVVSVVLALVLLNEGLLRGLVLVLGVAWVIAMAGVVVVAAWHRPSDVLAAVLVCLCFAATAVAVVGPGDRSYAWA